MQITFNVWLNTNVTSFQGWYRADDFSSYNNTANWHSIFLWQDENTYYTSVGGSMTATTAGS